MANVKNINTGKIISAEEYYHSLTKSFIEEHADQEVSVQDIRNWVDYDTDFYLVDDLGQPFEGKEPSYELTSECDRLYDEYIETCKEYFGLAA